MIGIQIGPTHPGQLPQLYHAREKTFLPPGPVHKNSRTLIPMTAGNTTALEFGQKRNRTHHLYCPCGQAFPIRAFSNGHGLSADTFKAPVTPLKSSNLKQSPNLAYQKSYIINHSMDNHYQ